MLLFESVGTFIIRPNLHLNAYMFSYLIRAMFPTCRLFILTFHFVLCSRIVEISMEYIVILLMGMSERSSVCMRVIGSQNKFNPVSSASSSYNMLLYHNII